MRSEGMYVSSTIGKLGLMEPTMKLISGGVWHGRNSCPISVICVSKRCRELFQNFGTRNEIRDINILGMRQFVKRLADLLFRCAI